jgi:hypothetical protein
VIIHDRQRSSRNHLQIQPQRPILEVVEVVLDAMMHRVDRRGFTAKAVDLRPTGDAGPNFICPPNALAIRKIQRTEYLGRDQKRHETECGEFQ